MATRAQAEIVVMKALCSAERPCDSHRSDARMVVACLINAGYLRMNGDLTELIEASSLGTPAAKAARASVTDEQAQRAIEVAKRIRARGVREDPNSPGDMLCGQQFTGGELCERAAGHSGECTPDGVRRCCGLPRDVQARCVHHPWHPQTDDGAVEPPANPGAVPHPAAQAGQASWRPAPSSPLPRRFVLDRNTDVSGVSGTGVVAEGCVWSDGAVSTRWTGDHPSTNAWNSVDDVLAVHGHQGSTALVWLDPEETDRVCRACGCTDDTACLGGCYWVAPDLCSQCGDGPVI